jgi:hypothetical protein
VCARGAAQCRLAEGGGVQVALAHGAEAVVVALRHGGAAHGEQPLAAQQEPPHRAAVHPPGLQRLGEAGAAGDAAAALPVLHGGPHGEEERAALAVVPEEARAQHGAAVGGEVGPAVVVHVGAGLAVAAPQERVTPALRQLPGRPEHGVGAAQGAGVEEQFAVAGGAA